jgi:hypothetical protein
MNPKTGWVVQQSVSTTITVINDLVEITRYKIEAPAVGNPLSTPQLYLLSNIGNQVYQNSLMDPKFFSNAQVSATIQNSFSAGYCIQAAGDAPVKISTTTLCNVSFELVDGNFQPMKLLSPLYLTLSVNPVLQDVNNDLSQWSGKLPLDAPTSKQKAEMDAQAQAQQEAQAKADEEAKHKANTKALVYELLLQVLAPIVQRQMIQQQQIAAAQQVIIAEQQRQDAKRQIAANLIQDPDVIEMISKMHKKDVPKFIDMLVEEICKPQEEQTAETPAPTEQPTTETPAETPAEPQAEQPAPETAVEQVEQPTEQPTEQPAEVSLDDTPISGML